MNKKADKWLLPCWCLAVSFTLLTRTGDRESVLLELSRVTGRQIEVLEDGEKYAAWEE